MPPPFRRSGSSRFLLLRHRPCQRHPYRRTGLLQRGAGQVRCRGHRGIGQASRQRQSRGIAITHYRLRTARVRSRRRLILPRGAVLPAKPSPTSPHRPRNESGEHKQHRHHGHCSHTISALGGGTASCDRRGSHCRASIQGIVAANNSGRDRTAYQSTGREAEIPLKTGLAM
jgi:hypothetical protein